MFKTPITLGLLVALPFSAMASELTNAQSVQSKTNASSAASQKRVDKSAEQSIKLNAEIEQLQQEVKNLQVYQDHLNALVVSQEQEVSSLEGQIDEIKSTRQGVVPLMYQMIEGLKQNLAQDVPIKPVQRAERIAKLEDMMVRADIADAEKYRRILEAYQIELDYGTKLGLYQGQINADGKQLEVDVLHMGRLALIARSLNGLNFWSWDANNRSWQPLDSAMKTDLDKAYSIAAQQTAPSLVTLPVSLIAQSEEK